MKYSEFVEILNKNQVVDQNVLKKLEDNYGKGHIGKLFEQYLNDTSIDERVKAQKACAYLEELSSSSLFDGIENETTGKMEQDPVHMYLKEIGQYPLMTAEEEVEIFRKYENAKLLYEKINFEEISEKLQKIGYKKRVCANESDALSDKLNFIESKIKENDSLEELEELKKMALDIKDYKNFKDIESEICNRNLRLVVSIAKRFVGNGLSFLDLIQEGNRGLLRCIEKFEVSKGYKFSTYATWWIRQSITRAIADQSRTIRIPVHFHELILSVKNVEKILREKIYREPTDEEILDFYRKKAIENLAEQEIPNPTEEEILSVQKVKPAQLKEIRKIIAGTVSLDSPIGEEEDSLLGDFIQDDKISVEEKALQSAIKVEMVKELTGNKNFKTRELIVLALRNGLRLSDYVPYEKFESEIMHSGLYTIDETREKYDELDSECGTLTLEETGHLFGVTRERIRQIESKTIYKMRRNQSIKKLK